LPIRVPERGGKVDKPPLPVVTEETLIRLIQKVQAMAPRVEPEAYGIRQAVQITGLSRATLYKLMADGALKRVRVGGRALIKRSDLQRLLEGSLDGIRVELAP
jgi:excisionase family DNA binding protein